MGLGKQDHIEQREWTRTDADEAIRLLRDAMFLVTDEGDMVRVEVPWSVIVIPRDEIGAFWDGIQFAGERIAGSGTPGDPYTPDNLRRR